jgi:alanine racemase
MLLPHQITSIIAPKNCVVFDAEQRISELVFDSRKVTFPEQTLFFAIKTEKNDGHLYIPELIKQKVKNFIVSDNIEHYLKYNANFYQVIEPVRAMQQIAAAHRKRFNYQVVGITGSNGKTIVKEWLSTILSHEFSVIKSPNSYNSQIGVPLSVWQMNDNYGFAIFEAGISQPNEMEELEAVIKPDIGILTNIGNAHSGFFNFSGSASYSPFRIFARLFLSGTEAAASYKYTGMPSSFARSPPNRFDSSIQSSIVQLATGTKGQTSRAPMRGCSPVCLVMSM